MAMTLLQGSSKVHIISHSMGNRITSEALLQYHPAGKSNLGQLIFAAADVDSQVFDQRLAQLSSLGASSPQPFIGGIHACVWQTAVSWLYDVRALDLASVEKGWDSSIP